MAPRQGGLFGKYTPFWQAMWEGWHFRRDLGKMRVVKQVENRCGKGLSWLQMYYRQQSKYAIQVNCVPCLYNRDCISRSWRMAVHKRHTIYSLGMKTLHQYELPSQLNWSSNTTTQLKGSPKTTMSEKSHFTKRQHALFPTIWFTAQLLLFRLCSWYI